MPSFENFETSQITKMLLLGDSGAGKTGSLCSLAAAGYNVRIADMDKGVEVINDYLKNPKSIYRQAKPGLWTAEQAAGVLQRMSYVQITDSIMVKNGFPIPKGDGWQKLNKQLDDWQDVDSAGKAVSLGNVGTWRPQDVLVLDSLSRISDASLNYNLVLQGRALKGPELQDWSAPQMAVRNLLAMLYSAEVSCNVIVIAHVKFIENDMGITKGYPQTIGKALSPQIGQYFNHALLAKEEGGKRVIITNSSGVVSLKNSAPLRVAEKYPLETGLANFFADLRANRVEGEGKS